MPWSALCFTRVGVTLWMSLIVVAWGLVTMAFALVRGPASLYVLRVLLGAAEAGTMPGCWFLLSRHVPAHVLPYAYSITLIFTVLAQVIGAPLGALFLGPMEGVAGISGWRWMFALEGAITTAIGAVVVPLLTADTVGQAKWYDADEKRIAAAALTAAAEADGAPAPYVGPVPDVDGALPPPPPPETVRESVQAAARIVTVWQIWVLGIAVMLTQVAFFGVLFFAPLEIASAFGTSGPAVYTTPAAEAHKAMIAALKSLVVFGPAAIAMVLAGAWVRFTGDRTWICAASLTVSTIAFALTHTAATRAGGGAGLAALAVGAATQAAVLSPLTTWPHRYIGIAAAHGAAAYAFWNAFVAVSGVVGPYAFGSLSHPAAFGLLAGCQAVAAVLLLAFGLWEKRAGKGAGTKAAANGHGG